MLSAGWASSIAQEAGQSVLAAPVSGVHNSGDIRGPAADTATFTMTERPKAKRSRLDPDERRQQLLRVATELLLQEGVLPLPMPKFSEAAQVSKGLIYSYFPTQYELFNALLREHFAELNEAGLIKASKKRDLGQAAKACAAIYFNHVATRGPVIHLILRDLFMSGQLDPGIRQIQLGVAGRLARLARTRLKMKSEEAIAAYSLLMAIPEDAGRLVFQGELPLDRGRELCMKLVDSALAAIA
jgi:AcrR family transcriptional regulator